MLGSSTDGQQNKRDTVPALFLLLYLGDLLGCAVHTTPSWGIKQKYSFRVSCVRPGGKLPRFDWVVVGLFFTTFENKIVVSYSGWILQTFTHRSKSWLFKESYWSWANWTDHLGSLSSSWQIPQRFLQRVCHPDQSLARSLRWSGWVTCSSIQQSTGHLLCDINKRWEPGPVEHAVKLLPLSPRTLLSREAPYFRNQSQSSG